MDTLKNENKNFEYIGYGLVFLAGALWGTIGLFVKQMQANGADALQISFLRVSFAFLLMLFITMVKNGRNSFAVSKKALFYSMLLGVVCHGVYNIFYCYAVMLAGVTISAVLLNVAPVFTFLVSAICFSEKADLRKIVALVINVIGCILAATGGKIDVKTFALTGVLCGVGAGICYGMTAIFGRYAAENTDPFVMSTYSYFFAAVLLLIPSAPWKDISVLTNSKVLWYGFLLALIPTAIAYVLYYYGLQRITESSKVPVIASIETVVAAILGIMVYHETIGKFNILGIIAVLISIYLMNQKQALSGGKNNESH